MGLIRKIAKYLTFFLFSLFLSLSILTFFLYDISSYDNLKNIFTTIFKEVVMRNTSMQEIEEIYNRITTYCNLRINESVELSNNVSLKCSEIINTNSSYMIYLIAEKSFDQIYYKSFECEMLECVKKIKSGRDIFFLLSFKTHEFLGNIFQYFSILTFIFGILLFISIETWSGRLKTFGFEFLSIGIFYFLLPYFKKFISESFLKEVPIGENILESIFNQFNPILITFFICGVILIAVWVLLKIFIKKSR